MGVTFLAPAVFSLLVAATFLIHALAARAAENPASVLPEAWLARWRQPPAEDRPLQIVHGIDPGGQEEARNSTSAKGTKGLYFMILRICRG